MIDEKKDEALTSRLRSKVKPEKREPIEETEAPRKTRRRGELREKRFISSEVLELWKCESR